MAYTRDWNGEFIGNTGLLPKMDLVLEIGCFEGLTSDYIVKNLLTENGKLICMDPLADEYLVTDLAPNDVEDNRTVYSYFKGQYDRFMENIGDHIENGKVELIRQTSEKGLPDLINSHEGTFDLVYVDGDHRASAVYVDGVSAFLLCKIGGHVLFDDYQWTTSDMSAAPKIGIDRFLLDFQGRYELVLSNYQVMIKKLS